MHRSLQVVQARKGLLGQSIHAHAFYLWPFIFVRLHKNSHMCTHSQERRADAAPAAAAAAAAAAATTTMPQPQPQAPQPALVSTTCHPQPKIILQQQVPQLAIFATVPQPAAATSTPQPQQKHNQASSSVEEERASKRPRLSSDCEATHPQVCWFLSCNAQNFVSELTGCACCSCSGFRQLIRMNVHVSKHAVILKARFYRIARTKILHVNFCVRTCANVLAS